jgi:hypothetical protein
MADRDCLRMERVSVMAGCRRQVAEVGIDFVEDTDFVADTGSVVGVVGDSPVRMELAVVEVLDHR